MEKKSTEELNELLENVKPWQMDAYLKANKQSMVDHKKAFYYYMKDILDEKNIRLKDLYSFAGVSESYGGKIITMEKHTASRDLILRFCFAGHFSWDETNRALKLYGFQELYSRDSRDAVLIVAIHNRIYNLGDVDEMLVNHGQKRLTKE